MIEAFSLAPAHLYQYALAHMFETYWPEPLEGRHWPKSSDIWEMSRLYVDERVGWATRTGIPPVAFAGQTDSLPRKGHLG
jgi:hypothetical protein